MKTGLKILIISFALAIFQSCSDKGPVNKTLTSKKKPSKVLSDENKKHNKKLEKRGMRRIKKLNK
jgi:hypothetical protein